MNGGFRGAPGAGSPALASCSPQKMCSWVLGCCLALQVRGDRGEQPERWGEGGRSHGWQSRGQGWLGLWLGRAGRGVGSGGCCLGDVSGHASTWGGWARGAAALGAAGSHDHPLSSPHSTWPCRPPCCASSTSSCCPPCPRSCPMPRPPASCWHAASLPVASPPCCRPPWGAGEQGGRGDAASRRRVTSQAGMSVPAPRLGGRTGLAGGGKGTRPRFSTTTPCPISPYSCPLPAIAASSSLARPSSKTAVPSPSSSLPRSPASHAAPRAILRLCCPQPTQGLGVCFGKASDLSAHPTCCCLQSARRSHLGYRVPSCRFGVPTSHCSSSQSFGSSPVPSFPP